MRVPITSLPIELGEIETGGDEWREQIVRHVDLAPGADLSPLLVGLPGNMCLWPLSGVVRSGAEHLAHQLTSIA